MISRMSANILYFEGNENSAYVLHTSNIAHMYAAMNSSAKCITLPFSRALFNNQGNTNVPFDYSTYLTISGGFCVVRRG